MYMIRKDERGRWTALSIIAVALISVGVICSLWGIIKSSIIKSGREREERIHQTSILPPGTKHANSVPTPLVCESNVGGKWITAKMPAESRSAWNTVVYYPYQVKLINLRRVNVDKNGKDDPNSSLISYEVTASARAESATENFRTIPLSPPGKTIFKPVYDSVLDRLEKEIVSSKLAELE